VAPQEEGEIQIGSERALLYYWKNFSETKKVVQNGWFSTGDIGCFDLDDLLYVVDRKKDMIIRGGFNVYPAEMERVLLQDHRVQEALVVGMAHDRLGEVPKAFVVRKEGEKVSEGELLDMT
jgi:long-chain acyl-CoA synthetase